MNHGADLTFRPIDLGAHAAICLEFRRDSFVCSFGTADGLVAGYLDWLRKKLATDPESCVHVWRSDAIIGQIEIGSFKGEPTVGYVNLYYLVPDARGLGLGAVLDEHVTAYLRAKGFTTARLSVSPTNSRAMRFYQKHGWRDLGPRPGSPLVRRMQKVLG